MLKKTLILLLISLIASCDKNPDQKAHDIIKQYFSKNLDDPKSYDPVYFSGLDSTFSTRADTISLIIDSLIKASRRHLNYSSTLVSIGESPESENKKVDSISVVIDSLLAEKVKKENQRKFLTGWKITHSFRAKNKFGALVKDSATFIINTKVDSIITIY